MTFNSHFSNSSFETNTTGWSTIGTVPPTLSRVNEITAKDGSWEAKIAWGLGGTGVGISATLTGLQIGKTYNPGIWIYAPSINGVDAGVVIASGPSGTSTLGKARDTWHWCSVQFTATSTSHDFQIWPSSLPSISGQKTYVDFAQSSSTPRLQLVKIPDGYVSPKEWNINADSLENWPVPNDVLPSGKFDGYLGVDATSQNRLWVNSTTDFYTLFGGYSTIVTTKSGTQSISSGVTTAVTWDVDEGDTDAYHTLSSSVLTIPFAGDYFYQYVVQMDIMPATGSSFVSLQLNGTTLISHTNASYPSAFSATMVSGGIYTLAANDTLELFVRHIGGTTKNILAPGSTGTGAGQTRLSVYALRART